MPPRIAIVGRPNVGKSTLFNRLVGRRTALVSDLPGLTRDRREEPAEIAGNGIVLIDTAGLEEAAAGSIPDRMRGQSTTAMASADLILFVVDARAGITPSDRAFANEARRSGRPVLLIANKCEGRAGEARGLEAYALGFGTPVLISAEHGEGMADLEAAVLDALGIERKPSPSRRKSRRQRKDEAADAIETPPSDDAEATDADAAAEDAEAAVRPVRVAVVGRPNAGKSTLVNAILGEERMITGPEPGLTRDAISTDLTWRGRTLRLFDTAGLRRRARVDEVAEKLAASDAVRAIRFADVVVLLIDAERAFEQQDLTIGNRVIEEGRALVIVVNKWDTVADKPRRLKDLRETVAETFAEAAGVTILTVSALSGRGVDRVLDGVLAAYEVWNRRIGTADLNRWLQEALDRHTPPAASGRRIRLRFITQPSTRPPTFVAFCSKPDDLPRSYVKYLVNSLRDAFDLPGTPIRFNLRKGSNPYDRR